VPERALLLSGVTAEQRRVKKSERAERGDNNTTKATEREGGENNTRQKNSLNSLYCVLFVSGGDKNRERAKDGHPQQIDSSN
jgi:hypothetical protein